MKRGYRKKQKNHFVVFKKIIKYAQDSGLILTYLTFISLNDSKKNIEYIYLPQNISFRYINVHKVITFVFDEKEK